MVYYIPEPGERADPAVILTTEMGSASPGYLSLEHRHVAKLHIFAIVRPATGRVSESLEVGF